MEVTIHQKKKKSNKIGPLFLGGESEEGFSNEAMERIGPQSFLFDCYL